MRLAFLAWISLLAPLPLAAAEVIEAQEGVVVEFQAGDELVWRPPPRDYWVQLKAGAEGGAVRWLSPPEMVNRTETPPAAPVATPGGTPGPVATPGSFGPHGGQGSLVNITQGQEARLLVEDGSGRAILGRTGLLRGTGNGTVGVLRVNGTLAPGACAAYPFSSGVFGSLRGDAVPRGPVTVEAGGPGVRFRLYDEDFGILRADTDVLSLRMEDEAFSFQFFVALQACAPEDASGPSSFVARVTRVAPTEESEAPPRDTPAPAWLAPVAVAAALALRRRA